MHVAHMSALPRGGGLAIVVVSVMASSSVLLTGGLPGTVFSRFPFVVLLAVVGFLDDQHNLSAGLRYGVQLGTSLMVIMVSALPITWFALPLLLIAITGLINFINFMDGLDGLVAGCMQL